VDVLLDGNQLLVEEVDGRLLDALVLAVPAGDFVHVLDVVSVLDVGHVGSVEDVVDVFQHFFSDDLRVHHQEGGRQPLGPCLQKAVLHVVTPVLFDLLVLGDLDLLDALVHGLIGYFCARLPA